MHCRVCDVLLTDEESVFKVDGEYQDTCFGCMDDLNILLNELHEHTELS